MFAAGPEDDVAEQPRWQQVPAEPQLQQYGWKKLMCTTTKNKKTKLVKYQSPTGVYYKNLADAQAAIARAAFEASGSDLDLRENIDAITERYLNEEVVTTSTPVQNARSRNPESLTPVSYDRRQFTPPSAVLRRAPASSTPPSSLKRRNSRTAGHQDEYVSPSKRLSMSTPQRPAASVESSLLNTPPGSDLSFSLNERVAASDVSYERKTNGFQTGQAEMFKSYRPTPELKVKIAIYSCEQCESKFKTREFLNKHKLEMHLKNNSPISQRPEPTVFSMATVASSIPSIPPGPPIQGPTLGSTMQPYELKVPNLVPRQMGKANLQQNEKKKPTDVIPRLKPKKKVSSMLSKTLPKIHVGSYEIEEEDEVEEMEVVSSSSRVNVAHAVDSDQTQDYFDAMDTLEDENYDDDEGYPVHSKRNHFEQNTFPGRNLPSFVASNPQGRKIPSQYTSSNEDEENEEYFSASDDDSKSFPSDSEEEEEREKRVVNAEPEEITLDESDDEINVVEDVHLAQAAKERMRNEFATLVENEDQLAHDDFVEYILGDAVASDQYQRETWYCQPANWKPKGTESWNATVSQIANFYKLRDFSTAGLPAVSTWDEFHEMAVPRADQVNPGKSLVHLYKLMKAKWFESLEPVIPAHMKVVVETLDDEDL